MSTQEDQTPRPPRDVQPAIVISKEAFDEAGVTVSEFQEAWEKGGGVVEIPKRITLTHRDVGRIMRGEVLRRHGIEIEFSTPYEPNPTETDEHDAD